MGRTGKTKDDLLKEISDLRECVTQFEKMDTERKNVETDEVLCKTIRFRRLAHKHEVQVHPH